MNKANNFQIAKIQPQGAAQLLFDFSPISAGVAYKSVAFKKACIWVNLVCRNFNILTFSTVVVIPLTYHNHRVNGDFTIVQNFLLTKNSNPFLFPQGFICCQNSVWSVISTSQSQFPKPPEKMQLNFLIIQVMLCMGFQKLHHAEAAVRRYSTKQLF